MADPFHDVIERDLSIKCSADASELLCRAFQLCESQWGCVVVGTAGVAGAIAALVGAFYASYEDELTPEIIDGFWRDMMRGIVIDTVAMVAGPVSEIRAQTRGKPERF